MKEKMVYKGNNVVGAFMNVPIFVGTFPVMTDFAVLENIDAYRDEGMGDVIFGEPFLREVGIKTRRLEGIITIYNGDDEVNYQMVRSHPSEDADNDRNSDDERTESDEDKSIDLNKANDEEEDQGDESVHTPNDYVPIADETRDVDDEEYVRINKELYHDLNVDIKDAEPADEGKEDEEMTNVEKVQQEIPKIQSSLLLTVSVSVIPEPTVLSLILEITTEAPATTISPFITPFIPLSQESTRILTPSTTEATTSTPIVPKSETLLLSILEFSTAVKECLGTSLGEFIKEHFVPADVIEVLKQQLKPQKSVADIRKIEMEHATKQQESQYTIKSSNKAALNEFDKKQAIFETMTKSKSFNKHPKHITLYHALMESILADKDAMDQGVADNQKKRKLDNKDRGLKKRKTSKDAEPPKRPKSTGSSKDTTRSQPKLTCKFVQSKETVFEAVDTEMPLNQGDETGNTNSKPKVEAVTKDDWFKKPTRPPTPDPEWIQGKSVDNEPKQTWLNDLANA
ncbi:hypothetical protein Tco_0201152 [Tanacetum coccineum]